MGTSRRVALKRGLVLLAGAVGVSTGRAVARAGPPTETLTLYGADWHSFSQVKRAGELPARGDRMLASGDLRLAPGGDKVGEFHAACFSLAAPASAGPAGAGSLELHTLNLPDGSIIGTGTATHDPDREDTFAVVGGTGRFSGARGTYTARQRHRELGGDGTAELTLHLLLEEG